jgi:hypothetical protein
MTHAENEVIQSLGSGFLVPRPPPEPYGRKRMNADSWWNAFASPAAIASACAGAVCPYA